MLAAGCNGTIGDLPGIGGGPGSGGNSTTGTRPPSFAEGCGAVELPAGPLRHLTRAEYDNVVRALLGDDSHPAQAFPPDDNTDGIEVGLTVSPLHAEKYFEAAELLAERAVTTNLSSLLPCDPATDGEDACGAEFIDTFAPRAWRRPLTADERARFVTLFSTTRDGYDFATGVQQVIHAALASPNFLYHFEEKPADATANDIVQVTGYAMANRLSFFLWSSMPDDTLFAAAESGALDSPEGIAVQARRMLEDPRAKDGVRNFFRQWLELDRLEGLEKDATRYPEFDGQLADAMRESLDAYVDYVFWEGDGSVETLLTGDFAFVNARLAGLYGMVGVEGTDMQRMTVDTAQRGGLLTQPGLLAVLAKANQSDPVHRGKFVRERMLCQQLPPPPDDIVIRAPDPAPGLSTRERFAEHSTNEACVGCHELMDPIGFAFENFDAIGQWRDEDEGMPVDASGELLRTADIDGAFDGVNELSQRLASSNQVKECVARQAFRFSIGRVETMLDSCALDALDERFAASGWNMRELMVSITQTDAFLYRRIPEGL